MKPYVAPELEVFRFAAEDVLLLSALSGQGGQTVPTTPIIPHKPKPSTGGEEE